MTYMSGQITAATTTTTTTTTAVIIIILFPSAIKMISNRYHPENNQTSKDNRTFDRPAVVSIQFPRAY